MRRARTAKLHAAWLGATLGVVAVTSVVVACSLALDGFTSTASTPDDAPTAPPPGDVADVVNEAPAEGAPPDAACAPPTNGLLAHYSMDHDAIVGTRVVDSSGHAADGTLVGFPAAPTAPGHFGDALVFPTDPDASAAYVDVPSGLAFDTSSGAANSVSLWFFRSSAPGVDDVLVYFPPGPRYDIWLTRNGTALCLNAGNYDCFGVEDATLLDRWVHLVAVFVNGPTTAGEVWIDGVRQASTCLEGGVFLPCTTSRTVGPPYSLGGRSDFLFHGKIDDVRFYARRLEASEIATLAHCP
jgi:hypothetical protein